MNIDTLKRPYQWPVIGPMLKERAQNIGLATAYQLYENGLEPERMLRYANNDIRRAAHSGTDRELHEALGLARGARTIAAALHED